MEKAFSLLCLLYLTGPRLYSGFYTGIPNRFHCGISHSLGFARGFGFLMSFVFLFMKNQSALMNFVIFFSLYFFHVLLDLLSEDSSPPYGVPALWPVTTRYYISPKSVFLDIQRSQVSETFLRSLISFHNFLATLIEIFIFLPLVVIVSLFKRNRVRIVRKVFRNE